MEKELNNNELENVSGGVAPTVAPTITPTIVPTVALDVALDVAGAVAGGMEKCPYCGHEFSVIALKVHEVNCPKKPK